MATRTFYGTPEFLKGFKAGVEFVNDSALEVVSFERLGPFTATLVIEDQDAEESTEETIGEGSS